MDEAMHISEGVLATPVLLGCAALTAAGLAVALKKLNNEDIPKEGVLSAGFFVAGLIQVPIGVTSVHLVLKGLVGLILGWLSFPAIFVGLLLQSIMFQYGGMTPLGVNTFNMAFPALVSCFFFGRLATRTSKSYLSSVLAFLAGSLAVFLSGILVGISLYLTGDAFLPAAKIVVVAHIPVMLIEGVITAACVTFLKKVKPELLSVV
jgi:cobalt/nickel transport system permease protein